MPWNEGSLTLAVEDYGDKGTYANGTSYNFTNCYAYAALSVTTSGTSANWTVTMYTSVNGNHSQKPGVSLYLAIGSTVVLNNYWKYEETSVEWNQFPTYSGSSRSGTVDIGDSASVAVALKIRTSANAPASSWQANDATTIRQASGTLSRTWVTPDCSISSVTVSPTSVLAGNSVTATPNGVSPSDASITYQWYTSSDIAISGATSATRTPTSHGEYCTVSVNKTGYNEASKMSSGITYYTQVTNATANATNYYITESIEDGRFTDRESYTFNWAAGSDGTNNAVDGYYLEVYVGNTKKFAPTTNSATRSMTYTSSELGIKSEDSIWFKVKTKGVHYDAADWVTSGSLTIVPSAIMHVNASGWKTGLVYVNKGSESNPNWVEATEVKIKDGTQWKDSI